MKKLGIVLGLGLLGVSSLFADYQLTLIDKDGTETSKCIKSYSFSNNLESLARKNSVGVKDVYSENETLTNKIYLGKPVYRKVFLFDDFTFPYGTDNLEKETPVISDNIDRITSYNYMAISNGMNILSPANSFYHESILYSLGYCNDELKKCRFTIHHKNTLTQDMYITDLRITVEYTKTTDEANSSSNTFKSYLYYVPSSSTTNQLISVDLEDKGVKFLKGYTYNFETDSCTTN